MLDSGGGAATYARLLLDGLDHEDGCRAVVVGPCPFRPPFTPWGRTQVAGIAARAGIDLVHGLHVEAPPVRVPVVITIHDVIPLDHPASMPNPLRRLAYRRILGSSLRRAARIIVPSELTRDRLVTEGADPERVDVVPLAVAPWFRPVSAAERDAGRRRFAGGRRYVVASTGARAHKNLAGMSAAARLLPGDVIVAATGRSSASAIRSVGLLGDDDLRLFYGAAEAMVLPAHVEGFGLPAVEALACGTPVVCGPNMGALASIGAGALEVSVARPDELAAAIRAILDDDSLRTRLGSAGPAAVARFTPATMAAATVDVYERALSR